MSQRRKRSLIPDSTNPRWGNNIKTHWRSYPDIYQYTLVRYFICSLLYLLDNGECFFLQSLCDYIQTCLILAAIFFHIVTWLVWRLLTASSRVSPVVSLGYRLPHYLKSYLWYTLDRRPTQERWDDIILTQNIRLCV